MTFYNQTLPVSRDTVTYAKLLIRFTETAINLEIYMIENWIFKLKTKIYSQEWLVNTRPGESNWFDTLCHVLVYPTSNT